MSIEGREWVPAFQYGEWELAYDSLDTSAQVPNLPSPVISREPAWIATRVAELQELARQREAQDQEPQL